MRFGLHLPSAQPGANAADILAVAGTAERLAFDSVWMFDHLFTPVDLESKYPYSRDGSYAMSASDPFFDPAGVYGVLAGATERIRIGTGVTIAAYRHPIVLGKALATIEQFAPGRVVLGLGRGWMREEFDALGVGFERRGARLEEYVRALRAIWSGEPSSFSGEFYSWEEAGFLPAPTTHLPILLGGHGNEALRRTAELADGWVITTSRGQGAGIEAVAARLDVLKAEMDKRGRDLGELEIVYPNLLWFSDQPNPKMPLTGTPEDIAGSIKRLEEIGVTTAHLIVFGPGPLVCETAERFAEEVLPLL
ncbi:MAG: TIGR03619 family F420-dependent LLM class oxidoreductase [Actinomycetota bacterium]|nr:TIGR03619 family F420-dependent LLM class oxidoreductase [Actinomycetota bacterium]